MREPAVNTFAYSLLAAAVALFISTGTARAAGRSQAPLPPSSTVAQQSSILPPAQSKESDAPIDWGRSLPDEEDWPLEEREGLQSDLLEHDVRDSQIDKAFETAETSDSDEDWSEAGNTKGSQMGNSGSGVQGNGAAGSETGHHWDGDLSAYDRQLKEIKAEAERTKKTRARVVPWQLRIAAVRDSHPVEWVKMFSLTQGKHVVLTRKVIANHADLLKKLAKEKAAKKPTKGGLLSHEIVSVGGAWLKPAVQQGLLTPLPFAQQSEWWERLGPKWRRFVTRNADGDLDSKGSVYAVPYRFGQIVVAYRADMIDVIGGPIEDWGDLFRPQLKGQVAMLGAPQEVVGIVLKSLGASANARNFDRDVPGGRQALVERYIQLRKQVRVFGDVQFAPALRNGDVLAAVGWAENFLPIAARMSAVKTVTPASGTLLWADFWGVPSGSELTPVSQQWLDYCLQPDRAKGLGAEKLGLSPLILPPFPESPVPGLPLQAQLASANGGDWRMAIANRDDGDVTSERRQSGAGASTGPAESNEGRARFNGLYAPRMAVSAQVSGVGKGPFEKGVTSGQLPRLEVLDRSELLEPLDERGQAEFRWLLGLVEEMETESLQERAKRRWGEVVEVGGGVRNAARTKVQELTNRMHALRAASSK
ncbi:putrescine-binding periplasmic protein [Klebsormidium nitens]|uniref:Putrescine-binding periplasmic protein n=1 Tax=Klebsormidium nitens TaxID=105231 RepID=A0A1Y1HLH0_KLENI|nr:putrescine-binding periplasmic protein [Klebsormidium nitens]|eukprot:GAQ77821.1 putrescine-binding periplasmic protein [Klebsormidium nitens]